MTIEQDPQAPQVRERTWVTKIDHSVDPPRAVEEVFVENGRLVSRRDLTQPDQKDSADADPHRD